MPLGSLVSAGLDQDGPIKFSVAVEVCLQQGGGCGRQAQLAAFPEGVTLTLEIRGARRAKLREEGDDSAKLLEAPVAFGGTRAAGEGDARRQRCCRRQQHGPPYGQWRVAARASSTDLCSETSTDPRCARGGPSEARAHGQDAANPERADILTPRSTRAARGP